MVEGEQVAVGGGSAERKAEELAAAGDRTAALWAAGAAGERRVADALANLREAWTVLHDRLIRPGRSEANLDHVVIGPAGLFLVDAKNWSGNLSVWGDGLYQHGGAAGARSTNSKDVELAKVHGMAAYMAVEMGQPITPVACLAGEGERKFGEPQLIRGVWVVPVSKLVAWLKSRPVVLDREAVGKAATRAMTSFPSTTTDPDLLAAMGVAASMTKRGRRRGPSRGRRAGGSHNSSGAPSRQRNQRRRSHSSAAVGFGRFIGRLFLGFLVILLLLAVVPPLLTAGLSRMTTSTGLTPSKGGTATPQTSPPIHTGEGAASQPKAPVAPTLPDCATATAAKITKIVGRKVQPIAVTSGCAWGTRLDDSSTTLVTIRMSGSHPAYDTQLETSVKQRRVVYGSAVDAHFRPATALWVATAQPITNGKSAVYARADTKVVVSRTMLNVSDDRARSMALAIAAAANAAE